MSIGLEHYLFIGAVLFVCGVVCMATTQRDRRPHRRGTGAQRGEHQPVAFSHFNPAFEIEGMTMALLVIVMAAGEAAVALAIVLNFYNNHLTVDVDQAEEVKG